MFSVCGAPVNVVSSTARLGKQIESLWESLFVLGDEPIADTQVFVALNFTESIVTSVSIPSGETVYESDGLTIHKTSSGFIVESGKSYVDLDVSSSQGNGVIDHSFWGASLEHRREFFLLTLLMALRPHGYYGLHADAVVIDDTGYLVVGESGAGKTTLTLALIDQGWQYLSDDALTLKVVSDSVKAFAFRRGFSLTSQTRKFFPRSAPSHANLPIVSKGKVMVDIAEAYPYSQVQTCAPSVILFPTIADSPTSRLVATEKSSAIVRLVEQSPGIMTDKTLASRQLAALGKLVDSAQCYRIEVGRDVYENPNALAELIRKAGKA